MKRATGGTNPDANIDFPMSSERRAASELQSRLRAGEFVVTAEITPPVSTDPAEFLKRALPLKGLATAVNVTDGAGAKVHLSSLAAAHFLVQSGIEPIFQMTCRDRNRLALQGDILGAASLGIHNILDPRRRRPEGRRPARGEGGASTSTAAACSRWRNRMRTEHKLPPGTEIEGRLDLVLGVADIPADPAPDWTPKGLLAKAAAGADFVQTQFCMDVGVVRRYAGAAARDRRASLPILIGVAPIPSARSARWMREKLFGTRIPDAIVERLEKARGREGARA